MIISSIWEPHLDQLKSIDFKSYYWPWYDEGWKTANEYTFRVLADSKHVYGFYCFQEQQNTIFLAKLCIHPLFRRNGLGWKLHKDFINNLKKPAVTVLHEESEYLELARSWGWIATKILSELYPDKSDGYVFRRKL